MTRPEPSISDVGVDGMDDYPRNFAPRNFATIANVAPSVQRLHDFLVHIAYLHQYLFITSYENCRLQKLLKVENCGAVKVVEL